jgi:anti-anti-sigma factor
MLTRSQSPRIFPCERVASTLIVTPVGDSLGVQELDLEREIGALHKRLEDEGITGYLVDAGKAPYFSSIVLGAVLAMCQKVRGRGGHVAFCNASEGMRDVMKIMKLDAVLPYYETREDALSAFEREGAPRP